MGRWSSQVWAWVSCPATPWSPPPSPPSHQPRWSPHKSPPLLPRQSEFCRPPTLWRVCWARLLCWALYLFSFHCIVMFSTVAILPFFSKALIICSDLVILILVKTHHPTVSATVSQI